MVASVPYPRSLEERNRLVLENQRFIAYVLKRSSPGLIRLLGGRADAFGVGQIALLFAAESWDPNAGAFSTYAITAIYRALWRYARRDQRHVHDVLPSGNSEPAAKELPEAPSFDEVVAAVKRLSDPERQLINERFWDGKKIHEIAAELGITHQAVSLRLTRTLKTLAWCLRGKTELRIRRRPS